MRYWMTSLFAVVLGCHGADRRDKPMSRQAAEEMVQAYCDAAWECEHVEVENPPNDPIQGTEVRERKLREALRMKSSFSACLCSLAAFPAHEPVIRAAIQSRAKALGDRAKELEQRRARIGVRGRASTEQERAGLAGIEGELERLRFDQKELESLREYLEHS